MEKIKQKLSSRKLWAGILAAVASIAAMCMGDKLTPEIVDALKVLAATCTAYIFGEGIVDASREKYSIDEAAIVRELAEQDKETAEAEEDPTAKE